MTQSMRELICAKRKKTDCWGKFTWLRYINLVHTFVKICVLRYHAWFAKVSWGTADRGLLPGLEGRGWHAVVVHAPRYWSRRSMRIGFGTRRGRLGSRQFRTFLPDTLAGSSPERSRSTCESRLNYQRVVIYGKQLHSRYPNSL